MVVSFCDCFFGIKLPLLKKKMERAKVKILIDGKDTDDGAAIEEDAVSNNSSIAVVGSR